MARSPGGRANVKEWLRIAGLAGWIGFLVLPFVGPASAALFAGATLLGVILWRGAIRASASERLRGFVHKIEPALRLMRGHRPSAPQKAAGASALGLFLILLPLFLNNYFIDVLTLGGIYVVLALGLNIVVGMAGILDLGYIAFYAIGAYSYALLSTRLAVSFWAALPIGGAVAALFGLILGLVTLRLRGDYVAIVTLGFIHIVNLVLKNWDSVTNGPNGILNIGRPEIGAFVFSQPVHFYYLILAIASLAVFTVNRLGRSRIGRAWIAIREDEIAAQAMGVNATWMKMLAFATGATWAGIAGVFFAGKFAFISPESFTFFESVIVLSMVVLGGMGSVPGVILGALVLVILPEMLREFSSYRMLVFGAAMVLMMLFRPQGMIGNPRRRIELRPEDEARLEENLARRGSEA